ncbi:MAG TPA: fatty acid/phospholipid synthesis protein PlsX [Ruminococcaceae bacterium]|nr:fatty acid/phospholipid synthesis protein PlsX [Oscillospiraceae bacterium]
MELLQFFKSIIDGDKAPVVICNLQHEIIYMNPAAKTQYAERGELVGKSLLNCHNERSNEMIKKVVDWFKESKEHNIIHTFYNKKQNKDVYMAALRSEDGSLIGYYEKHEYRNAETMRFYDFT